MDVGGIARADFALKATMGNRAKAKKVFRAFFIAAVALAGGTALQMWADASEPAYWHTHPAPGRAST